MVYSRPEGLYNINFPRRLNSVFDFCEMHGRHAEALILPVLSSPDSSALNKTLTTLLTAELLPLAARVRGLAESCVRPLAFVYAAVQPPHTQSHLHHNNMYEDSQCVTTEPTFISHSSHFSTVRESLVRSFGFTLSTQITVLLHMMFQPHLG